MRCAVMAPLGFVPIVVEPPPCMPGAGTSPAGPPLVEVKLAGTVLRVLPGTDGELLTTVLRVIRASAA